MLQSRNILVGTARLFVGPPNPVASPAVGASGYTGLPTLPTQEELRDALDSTAAVAGFSEVGYTSGGLEVSYEPDYLEVEVDQSKAPAAMVNQGLTVSFSTNLVEATLKNLVLAWGYDDDALSTTGNTFRLGDPDEPVERSILAVGRAPKTTDAGVRRERLYFARRVISIEGSSHAMRKTENVAFPVTFRLLPVPQYYKAEYGAIVDRELDEEAAGRLRNDPPGTTLPPPTP